MGVCVSVGYYGASWEEEKEPDRYDMRCPLLGKGTANNFWIRRCKEKLNNSEIKTCYGGCKTAKEIPELVEYIKKLKPKENKEFEADRYIRGAESNREKNLVGRSFISQRERQIIIGDMLEKVLVKSTMKKLGCGRTVISLYRRMYREGMMDERGNIKE